MNLLRDIVRSIIRTLGFLTKEIIGVIRQPRLIGSFVLGPFAIMLLFGLGFRGQQPEYDTTLVIPNDPAISADPQAYGEGFSGVFKLQEVTRDEAAARRKLEARDTDVVVIVPGGALEEVYSGRPASLPVLFAETDPTEAAWVRYFAYVQTSELNRRILAEIIRQSKGPAAQGLEYAGLTRAELAALRTDLQRGDLVTAAARVAQMRAATQAAQTGLARALDTLSEAGAAPVTAGAGQAARALQATDQELAALHGDLLQGPAGIPSALRRVDTLEAQNQQFEQFAQRVNSIPPETLVSPFEAEATNVLPVQPTALAYYTPAVIALLLQHMAITLAALSSVRDRLLGSLELFRVSPISAGNILTGKSLAYAFMLALVAVILTSAATTFLGVPSLGNPLHYWLSVGLTIFSALAIGFALSTIADSESQAVQLSMLVLLASVFFGGFFLPLEQLFPWVRALSFLLPVTYGSIDLREVMLRGIAPEWPYLVGPLVLGLFFYVIATLGLRRQMERA